MTTHRSNLVEDLILREMNVILAHETIHIKIKKNQL